MTQPSMDIPAPDFAGTIASELDVAREAAVAVIGLLDEGLRIAGQTVAATVAGCPRPLVLTTSYV